MHGLSSVQWKELGVVEENDGDVKRKRQLLEVERWNPGGLWGHL